MSDLIDRFTGASSPGRSKISSLDFTPMLNMYIFDQAEAVTISNLFDDFQQTNYNEWVEFDQILTAIDLKADGYEDENIIMSRKLAYISKADCIIHCLGMDTDTRYHDGQGNIDKYLACQDLEISGV